jgi:hypothetical protein
MFWAGDCAPCDKTKFQRCYRRRSKHLIKEAGSNIIDSLHEEKNNITHKFTVECLSDCKD